MLKGILYTALSKYSSVIITLVVSAILARLLTPEEFGIVALVSVFIIFFKLLGNLGIGPAVVQTKDLSRKDLSSIFSFSAFMGFVLSSLFFLSAGAIAAFYDEPELVPVVQLLSLAVLFNILLIVPTALNRKELRFKEMAVISISIQVLTGMLAIWMAYEGFSYYSLVVQSISSGILSFLVLFYLYPIRPTFKIKKRPLSRIASFSSYQFAFNFINYFSRNLDTILIGKYLGNAPLGYYNKSYALMLLPVRNLTQVITPVLHPVLSRHQENKKFIYEAYTKVTKLLALVGFPISVFLFFAAPELILLMFGPQWEQSVPVFKILAATIGIQVCLSSTGSIFQSVNRTDLLFLSGLLSAVLMIAGISYGVFIGGDLVSVGYGLLIAFIINFFQGFYLLIHSALGFSFWSFLKLFLLPILSALLGILIYIFLEKINLENYIWSLITKVAALCAILALFFFPSKENRELLLRVVKK